MNFTIKCLTFFSLFLAMLSAGAYASPTWFNTTQSILTDYNSSFIFEFNVTWQNLTGASITIYDFANSSHILVNNVTMTNNSDLYTYSIIMPAGQWNWTSYAFNDSDFWNSTSPNSFVINKAADPIYLHINNGTETINDNVVITYGTETNITCVSLGNCTIYRNGTDISQEGGMKIILGAGLYNYTIISSENENCTDNSTGFTSFLEVNRATTNTSYLGLYINGNNSNKTINYPSIANITSNMTLIGASDCNIFLYRNESLLTNGSNVWSYMLLGNGTWIFKSNSTGNCTNWTLPLNTTYLYLTVSPGAPSLTLLIDSIDADKTVTYPVQTSAAGYESNTGDSDCSYTLYRSDTGSITNPNIQTLTAATYRYVFNTTGCSNWTAGTSILRTLIVSSSSTGQTSSSSSSSSSAAAGSFLIKDLTSRLSVEAGQISSASFTLSNTLSNNIANVSITLTGIDASWYSLSKTSVSVLQKTIPQTVTITFNIPSSAQAGDYDVTVVASGKMLGETSSRSTPKTMTLSVTGPAPIAPLDIQGTSEDIPVDAAADTSASASQEENATANMTSDFGPTGLVSTFQYIESNLIFIIAAASCVLIFVFRNNITDLIAGASPKASHIRTASKAAKATVMHAPIALPALPSIDLKDKLNYKLSIQLKKPAQGSAKIGGASHPARPESLEREITRDIKELKSVLESEKRMKKKSKIENN